MGHESKYTIEGIEAVEAQIRHLVEDAGYLQVWDRTDRSKEHQVGRFNFTATDAQPFLDTPAPEVPDGDADGDLRTWDDFESFEDEPGEPESPAVDCSGGVPPSQMAEAGIRWLRQLLEVNTVGEEWARFRTRIYAPKGAKTLHTATVVVHNHNAAADDNYGIKALSAEKRYAS